MPIMSMTTHYYLGDLTLWKIRMSKHFEIMRKNQPHDRISGFSLKGSLQNTSRTNLIYRIIRCRYNVYTFVFSFSCIVYSELFENCFFLGPMRTMKIMISFASKNPRIRSKYITETLHKPHYMAHDGTKIRMFREDISCKNRHDIMISCFFFDNF